MGLFDGRVAIVTGAGRGIGREEALLLAAEGAMVVVNDLGGAADGSGADTGPAHAVVEEIESAGGAAAASTHDIATWAGGQAIVELAVERFGGLDVVINNAGILRDRMSFTMSEAEWDAVINVHLKGHFAVARHAAAWWRARFKETGEPTGGAIVNTSSESGLYGNAGQSNYAAAKAGIAALTVVLARELERLGVRVNAIAPVARTRLTEAVAGGAMGPDESGFDRFAPANVAAVACWLASGLAVGISGQVVKVQGGQVQLLEGWHPVTEVRSDSPWTLDAVAAQRDGLLGASDGSIPPFLPAAPATPGA
jgi:NAD(P)-dependent dehydrogenase (short-subunit alcohol dehydrogenase family)